MVSVCLYFKVHQPYRLTEEIDRAAVLYAAEKCYLPANELLLKLILQQQDQFKISFSISGTAIELFQQYCPEVIDSFQKLIDTGCVEVLGETYYHSLASLHSKKEWLRQVRIHTELVKNIFGITPVVYRNTELIHHNDFTIPIAELGFKGMLCEGVERILQGRSPNRVYTDPSAGIGLLLRNARLSDDIAFRFDDQSWSEHPLTADKFADWLHSHPADTEVINLFMDYETFGVHKDAATGIYDFLEALPAEALKHPGFSFTKPSAVLQKITPVDVYDVAKTISWEDRGDAACVWSENMMQHNMLRKIYSLENLVLATGCEKTLAEWGKLQSADHFYYMTSENEKYRNPYDSEEDAYKYYNKMISNFEVVLIQRSLQQVKNSSRLRTTTFGFF